MAASEIEVNKIHKEINYCNINEIFSTAKVGETHYFGDGYLYGVACLKKTENFITFSCLEPDHTCSDVKRSEIGEIAEKHGLMFHISLPEWEPKLYEKGINLLMPMLIKQHLMFKFLKSSLKMSDDKKQAGKDITVYAGSRPDKDLKEWHTLLSNIIGTLVNANIPPGYKVHGFDVKEHEIAGSKYITYRYDPESTNQRRQKKPVADPSPNPMEKLRIEVPEQGEPIVLEVEQNYGASIIKK